MWHYSKRPAWIQENFSRDFKYQVPCSSDLWEQTLQVKRRAAVDIFWWQWWFFWRWMSIMHVIVVKAMKEWAIDSCRVTMVTESKSPQDCSHLVVMNYIFTRPWWSGWWWCFLVCFLCYFHRLMMFVLRIYKFVLKVQCTVKNVWK